MANCFSKARGQDPQIRVTRLTTYNRHMLLYFYLIIYFIINILIGNFAVKLYVTIQLLPLGINVAIMFQLLWFKYYYIYFEVKALRI